MSTDLMAPRYKVVADYPHMENDQIEIGDIISPYGMGFMYPEEVKKMYESFPHLFRKLNWWEERRPEEMPEYVKIVQPPYKGEVLYLPDYERGSNDHEFVMNRDKLFMQHLAFCEPATEQEYLDYLNAITHDPQ